MTMVFDDHCAEIADLLNDDFLGNDLDAFISELESGDEAIAFADGAMLVDGISLDLSFGPRQLRPITFAIDTHLLVGRRSAHFAREPRHLWC